MHGTPFFYILLSRVDYVTCKAVDYILGREEYFDQLRVFRLLRGTLKLSGCNKHFHMQIVPLDVLELPVLVIFARNISTIGGHTPNVFTRVISLFHGVSIVGTLRGVSVVM